MRGVNPIRAVLALLLLLVVVAAAVGWVDTRRLGTANDWVHHTQLVGHDLEQLRGALVTLESGARGYALGGIPEFRQAAAEAEHSARKEVQELRKLTADNPRQQALLDELVTAVEDKVAFNESVMAARDREGMEGAARLVGSGAGIERMNQVTSVLARMGAEEERLLATRTDELTNLRRRTTAMAAVLMALLAVTLLSFAAQALIEIRARRRVREEIRLSEERFRLLLGAVRDYAILMLDPQGRVQSWSGAAERILGYTSGEVAGEHFSRFYPQDVRAQGLPERELEIAAREGRFEEEAPRLRADGTLFWADVVVTAIRGDDGELRGFAKVVRDVTERRKLDDALRETARQLEVSNRELQDFAMVASHDLQEPLRKIQMFGDKLKRRYATELSDEGRDWLTRMMNAAARGQSLIQGLLAFSRVTTKAQPPVPVDLSQTAREVVGDLEARIAEVHGQVEIGPLPTVDADPLQMRQLLQNLIGNALKFRRADEAPLVRIGSAPIDGARYRLQVADNGIGFEQKYVDRIFKLFQRLHERGAYEGSGMGLAICRKIVERHGGTITAQSAPGRGTTFVIDLPAHPPETH